jgi:endo-1,4-beta-xylanase
MISSPGWAGGYKGYREKVEPLVKDNFNFIHATTNLNRLWKGPGIYDFSSFIPVAQWASEHGLAVETMLSLIWGRKKDKGWNPAWLATVPAEDLPGLFEDYIKAFLTHDQIRRRINHLTAINEALAGWDAEIQGGYRSDEECKWNLLGWEEDRSGLTGADKINARHPVYIRRAFEIARRHTDAKLELRDYAIEFGDNRKEAAFYQLVRHLLSSGVPINAVGFQCHFRADSRVDWRAVERTVARYRALGLDVYMSELDGRIPWVPSASDLENQRRFYREAVFSARRSGVAVINVWGVGDAWDKGWFWKDNPLLFTNDFKAKPAYTGFMEGLTQPLPVLEPNWEELNAPVMEVTAESSSANEITLSWEKLPNRTAQLVMTRKLSGSARYTLIAKIPPRMRKWSDSGLSGGRIYNYRAVAVDAVNTPLATFEVTATTAQPKAGDLVWALLADHQSFRTAAGVWFEPEPAGVVMGGSLATWVGPVSGTPDPELYVGQRYGVFSYALPMQKGLYRVRVFVAETASNRTAGERRFDVIAEGATFAVDLDLAKNPGPRTAFVVDREIDVRDGALNLSFAPIQIPAASHDQPDVRDPDLKLLKDRNAMINAVEITLIKGYPPQEP